MATTKATITRAEYLQLVGLLTLAARHNQMLKEIAAAARALTGEEADMGHSSDAVYCDYPADDLLQRLGVAVEGAAPAAKKEADRG